jgi:DNA-binding PadR family transcriptional regulator
MMTNAELAILSLIIEQPRHGYEIELVIDERGMRDWTDVGFSSIYFHLNKLEKAGLILSHIEPAAGRGPARKVYRPTQTGIEVLARSVGEALAIPGRPDSSLQLGLANLPCLQPDKILEALRKRRQALIEASNMVSQKWESQRPLPYFVDAMFDNSLTMIQADLAWTEKFILRVEEENAKV